jgi:hypothetical protein
MEKDITISREECGFITLALTCHIAQLVEFQKQTDDPEEQRSYQQSEIAMRAIRKRFYRLEFKETGNWYATVSTTGKEMTVCDYHFATLELQWQKEYRIPEPCDLCKQASKVVPISGGGHATISQPGIQRQGRGYRHHGIIIDPQAALADSITEE